MTPGGELMDKAKTAGILSIISGALGFLWLGWMLFSMLMVRAFSQRGISSAPLPPEFFSFITIFYSAIGLFFALLGVLAIVGGVFAIKKKRWAMALAGAIAAAITFFPCGIVATIFVSLAQAEFATKEEGSELQKWSKLYSN